MSQNNNISSINKTSSDLISNDNNDWANFETTTSNVIEDNWADFQSDTDDKKSEKINPDDDTFGDYGEVQTSTKSDISSLLNNSEQINSLISTCFPLESQRDNQNFISFELPTFTTYKDQIKQLPCFNHSLSLWNFLSKISNDPIGIQHQWRKSNIEHLFHQALGVQERFRIKSIPVISENTTTISNTKSLSQNIDPEFDWKQSGLENPLTVFEVNKTLDLDYYIPINKEETEQKSSSIIYRTNSPIIPQQITPIKTMNLYPGSTTIINDDIKPVVNSISNFSFINPKALMSSNQITHESMI